MGRQRCLWPCRQRHLRTGQAADAIPLEIPQAYAVAQEWADYTAQALPWLAEDDELDAESHVPGQHHFEKMTSGLYMGDLARRIILRCSGLLRCS